MRARDCHFRSTLKPLVRYVDADQAVIDTEIEIEPRLGDGEGCDAPLPGALDVLVQVSGSDGFSDEWKLTVALQDGHGHARFDVVQPHRWWPAGMGEQTMYELTVSLLWDGRELTRCNKCVGLTSIRASELGSRSELLINGQQWQFQHVLAVDRVDERRMLPVAGNSLIVVRDHYGTDVLYDAADRAGLLLLQCVPIHPEGRPEDEFNREIERLVSHPSLAGWYVGHLGDMTDDVADSLHRLDPIHSVFRDVPGAA